MSFPPGEAQLIGSVIKVHGTMHAKAVRDKNGGNELDVDLDYLFVYPIEPPHQAASWMRVVDEESGSVDFGDWDGTATTFAPWDQFSNDTHDGGPARMSGRADVGKPHPFIRLLLLFLKRRVPYTARARCAWGTRPGGWLGGGS